MQYPKQPPIIHQIQHKLSLKYISDFFFYCSKYIEDLMCQNSDKKVINNKDIMLYAGDREYMRRIYRYYNAFDEKQIDQRIALFSQYQASVQTYGSFYPNMFISKTDKIFKARYRKCQKLKASCGSSDQSSSNQLNYLDQSFPTHGFLQSMKTPSVSDAEQIRLSEIFPSVQLSKLSIYHQKEQVHNIYEVQQQEEHVLVENVQIQSIIIKQLDIEYLITDFGDIDAIKIIKDYQQLMNIDNMESEINKKCQSQLLLNEGSEELKKKLDYHRYKYYKKQKIRLNGSDPFKKQRLQKLQQLNKYHNNSKNCLKEYEHQPKQPRRNHKPSNVRDKAKKLLEKVKNTDYI